MNGLKEALLIAGAIVVVLFLSAGVVTVNTWEKVKRDWGKR